LVRRLEATVRPPNSLILVVGSSEPEVPESLNGLLVASTASCVAVGTFSEPDGETTVVLTDERPPQVTSNLLSCAFSGSLESATGRVRLESVDGEIYLESSYKPGQINVTIWVDNSIEPSLIVVEATGR
jgi:hypothetical protein